MKAAMCITMYATVWLRCDCGVPPPQQSLSLACITVAIYDVILLMNPTLNFSKIYI